MDCGTVNTPQNRHIVTPNISPPCDWTGKPRKGKLVEVVVCFGGGQGRKWRMVVMRVVTGLSQICWDVSPQGQAAYDYVVWGKEGRESRGGYTYMQMVTQLLSRARSLWFVFTHAGCMTVHARSCTHAQRGPTDKRKKSRKNDSAPWTALAWIVGLLVGGRRGKVRGSMGDVSPSKHRLCTLSSWPW